MNSNISKLYLIGALFETHFFIAIMVPFLKTLGFTMTEIFLLEAAFALTIVILEIPTGYFADIYDRKTSLIISGLFGFTGISIFCLSTTFLGFLFGEILIAVSTSFASGAVEAFFYDTLLETNEEHKYKKVQGNAFLYQRLGGLVSTILGGAMASIFLRLPFYLSVIPPFIGMILIFTLHEPHRHKIQHEHWNHFIKILKESFSNLKLRWFIIFAAFPRAFFLMAFWMYQAYMDFVHLPILYFGIILAGMNIVSGLGSKFATEIEKLLTPKFSLVAVPLVAAISWLIMANVNSIWGIIFVFSANAMWGFFMPICNDFIQKIVTSDRRATVLSIMNLMPRLMFFAFSPILGRITDLYNVQTALLYAAIMLIALAAPFIFFFFRARYASQAPLQ